MKYPALASAALSLLAAPALAQDQQDGDTAGTAIIVLGEGLPETPAAPAYSTVELERDQIITSSSGRLEDVLGNVAGFQQFRRSDSRSANPSAQGATLRALGGNATSRALVLLDGVPLSDPFFGYIPFSSVDPSRLASIRVTRGGGSGPFGSGALAGTVRMDSADAATLGLFSASALVNDREETELSATIAPELGDGFAVIGGRWDRGQGFFTTREVDRVPASARASFESWSLSARAVQRVGEDVEVQARVAAWEDDRTLRFDGANNSIEGQDVSVRLVSRGAWEVDALLYGQWRNFSNVVISSTRFVRVLDQKDTPASGMGGRLELRPPVGDAHTLRVGADLRRSEGELFEDSYSAFTGALRENRFAGGVNTDVGVYIEDDWQLGALTLTGGVRADHYSIEDGFYRALGASGEVIRDDSFPNRSDWEVTWRSGALLTASDAVTLRAAAYSGFRLPTLNELYRPFVVFPVVTQANEALEPERLEGFELGIDVSPASGVALSATVFDNSVKGAIANVTLEENLRQRRNLDAIDAQGLELAAEIERGPFSVNGTMVLTDAEVAGTGFAADLDGNRPPQTPEFAASLTAAWRPAAKMLFSATLRHVSSQFEGDQENDILPAATTIDLFAQIPILREFSAVVRVENLLDEEVITRNQAGSIDIGAPQTIWAGVRWGF